MAKNVTKLVYSVVVPVYNSEASLPELFDRLSATMKALGEAYEIVFVNDASHDNSLSVLQSLKERDHHVVVIDLFRNFGQHNALMCGFKYCQGEYIITMDDDLQNPPEEIPKLIAKINEGYDAVIASYKKKKDKGYKNLGSYIMRKMTQKIFSLKNNLTFSSFRIIRRNIVDELRSMNSPFPYISGMILQITRNIVNTEVEHHTRKFGQSNYTLKRLIKFSFSLFINYSTFPLKVISVGGLAISILSFMVGVFVFIRKMMVDTARTGWTSTIMMISFFTSIFFLIAIIFGEYLKRILAEVENREPFVVKKMYTDRESDQSQE